MHPLYPPIKPYLTHSLDVSDTHSLYVEECGSPDGIPILFIHGGPGAGCGSDDRRFFDPEKYRIILFDQRGSGRSTPHAELTDNDSQSLISDIEKIRQFLNIEQWVLFGGSWGSTLALLYAQAHPPVVKAMILRGIFLCRKEDLTWFYQEGAKQIFPDYWRDFAEPIAIDLRDDMIKAYYDLLTGDNELAKLHAAKQWSLWEGRCATFRPNPNVVSNFCNTHFALSLARIEAHYFINNSFITENQILDNMEKIQHIPATIIHGRYDIVCKVEAALALHEAWPGSELQIIRDAGHSSKEPSILDALIKATDSLAFTLDNAT